MSGQLSYLREFVLPSVDDRKPVRPRCDPAGSCMQTLDWDGEVKCDPGGFQTAGLTDFITLELIPPNRASAPLLTIQYAIPIRLVTETFVMSG
ncbi:hypothetical protein C8R44DRAFT_870987 [Mycena epipterygia]|nr:hypothetical protein C8R44DRAFT_870987 [Mycena epipterygia]